MYFKKRKTPNFERLHNRTNVQLTKCKFGIGIPSARELHVWRFDEQSREKTKKQPGRRSKGLKTIQKWGGNGDMMEKKAGTSTHGGNARKRRFNYKDWGLL